MGLPAWASGGFAERAGTFKKAYKPNWHALIVADIYCDLLEASRAGRYKLLGFELEVERTPVSEPIRPDAVIHIKGQSSTVTLLLEAETGSHGLKENGTTLNQAMQKVEKWDATTLCEIVRGLKSQTAGAWLVDGTVASQGFLHCGLTTSRLVWRDGPSSVSFPTSS